MPTFDYPQNAEISEIAADFLADLTLQDPIFQIMPITTADSTVIEWEQEDSSQGLQQIRGIDGAPPKVIPTGAKSYLMQPGIYGEQLRIGERQLLERRKLGTFGTPVSIDDLVMPRVRQMKGREVSRLRQVNWAALSGTFSVLGANGAVVQTDTWSVQTYTAAVSWGTFATATPLADLSGVALLWAGHSVDFGNQATAFMNRFTFNKFRSNTNNADLYGRRVTGLATANGLGQINELLTGDDLPNVRVYDKGYFNDAGTFTRFIPNNTVYIVGNRDDGAPIGAYIMTRNAVNPGLAPGPYMKVVDTMDDPDTVPPQIIIHAGHNGGPVIYFPSAIVKMDVS
jgi:hypothetical protein